MIEDIRKLKSLIKTIIDEQKFLDLNISIGNIGKNSIMNHRIFDKNFSIFENFIKTKYGTQSSQVDVTEYYYKDLKLISFNPKQMFCFQVLPSKHYDFQIKNAKKNRGLSCIRLRLNNDRKINANMFPSIDQYDNFVENQVSTYKSRFKNSEINIKFIKKNKFNEICFTGKVDKINLDNFIYNIQYLLGKFYFVNIKLQV